MPHEAMHVFGSRGDGLFEGGTENLSRELSSEYGLRLTPTYHANETILWQKLEKVLGRNFLAEVDLDLEFDQVNDEYKREKHNKTLTPELKDKRNGLEESHIQKISDKLDSEIHKYFPDKIPEYRENLKRTCKETKRMIMSRLEKEYNGNDEIKSKKLMETEEKFKNLDFENQLSKNILDVNEILYQSVTEIKTDLGYIEEVYGPIINGYDSEKNGKIGLTLVLDDIISEKEKDGTIYTLGTDDAVLSESQQEDKFKYGKEAVSYQYKAIGELQEIISRIPEHLKQEITHDSFKNQETKNKDLSKNHEVKTEGKEDTSLTGESIGKSLLDTIKDTETRKNTINEINTQDKEFQNQKEGQSLDD